MRQSQGDDALGSWLDRHPLVGVGACLRHARLELDEPGPYARPALPHPPVGRVLRNRRAPRAEEIGAERDHVPRPRQVEGGHLTAAEAHEIGVPEHLVPEQLIGERRGSAETLEKLSHELGALACGWPAEEGERPLIASSSESVELCDELCQRLVPADFLELAGATRAAPFEGMSDAIRVIRDLNRRL